VSVWVLVMVGWGWLWPHLSWLRLGVEEDDVEAGSQPMGKIAACRQVAGVVGDLVERHGLVEGSHDGGDGVTAVVIEGVEESQEGFGEESTGSLGVGNGLSEVGEAGGDEGEGSGTVGDGGRGGCCCCCCWWGGGRRRGRREKDDTGVVGGLGRRGWGVVDGGREGGLGR
jgi:hypothetical protein